MTCAQRQDLLLLYAADPEALDRAEREALRAHLASGCPTCAASLAEAEAVVAQMAMATPVVAPPAGALETLMDRVATSNPARRDMRVGPTRSRRWLAPILAAAAAIAVTTGVFLYATRESRSFWTSRDLASVALASPTQPGATGQVLWDREHGRWRVSVANLAPTVAGREYELWVIPKDGKPIRSKTFMVDADRKASIVVDVPAGVGPVAVAAITDEPLGGTDAPTGQIHLAGEFR